MIVSSRLSIKLCNHVTFTKCVEILPWKMSWLYISGYSAYIAICVYMHIWKLLYTELNTCTCAGRMLPETPEAIVQQQSSEPATWFPLFHIYAIWGSPPLLTSPMIPSVLFSPLSPTSVGYTFPYSRRYSGSAQERNKRKDSNIISYFIYYINGMWLYSKKYKILLILGFYRFFSKYIKFCFQNLGNDKEDKTGSLLTSAFIFFTVSQILITNFYLFWTWTYKNMKLLFFSSIISP